MSRFNCIVYGITDYALNTVFQICARKVFTLVNQQVNIYITKNLVFGFAFEDPEAFAALQAAWELMATGTKSLREMARILEDQGVRDRRKGYKEYVLRPQTLSGIFRNKFYAGKVVSKKYGDEVQGQHTPMVTEEMFYRVQAILDGRNRNAAQALSRRSLDSADFPLRRVVTCGRCGKSFTGAWSKGKNKLYGYYFCVDRCGPGSSMPIKAVDDVTEELIKKISLKPKTAELINAFLRRTYYLRIGALQQMRDQAEIELKKVYQTRQQLIEKNMSGVYSDDIFKEQNKLLEEKIKAIQATKNDTVNEKYYLGAISQFIRDKLTDLAGTLANSDLERKRVLMCSIFPQGLQWAYPGYSNTQISPFYLCSNEKQDPKVLIGALEALSFEHLLG